MTDVPAPCLTMVHQSPVVTLQRYNAAWRMAELRPDLIQTLRELFRLHNFHIPQSQASSDPLTLFTRASNVGSRRFHNHGEGHGSKKWREIFANLRSKHIVAIILLIQCWMIRKHDAG